MSVKTHPTRQADPRLDDFGPLTPAVDLTDQITRSCSVIRRQAKFDFYGPPRREEMSEPHLRSACDLVDAHFGEGAAADLYCKEMYRIQAVYPAACPANAWAAHAEGLLDG